ncbi:putative glyoxalase superfamily protein PhnB [Afipia massiliensis]|uniref:Putative glyoxalase superfamily protein PhnB n=1 Tax=Afipia massiliensis TaxID=211460 RepID=A0A840NBG7_9BRAD|nr:glyoxalase [Afipia massiliensis]MBB5054026.1 putative glyoxalase superfamily protein PhnB [Afipia massiliensis]
MTTTKKLLPAVLKMRTFVPAKNFEESRKFYEALGFASTKLNDKSFEMRLGSEAFFLQNFYVKEFADNLMMQVLVSDLDEWWDHISGLSLERNFHVVPARPPSLQPWGLRVAYVWDPSGVLWHFASDS